MEFFVIKEGSGKGIYPINNEEEKEILIDRYKGCSYKIFKENEEISLSECPITESTIDDEKLFEHRMEYMQRVHSHRREFFKPSTDSTAKPKDSNNDFISVLKALRKAGYSCAKIVLSNEDTIDIVLDDVRVLLGGERIRFISLIHSSRNGLHWFANYGWKGKRSRNSYYYFMKKFDKQYKKAIKAKDKYVGYSDYDLISSRKECLKTLIYGCFEKIIQPLKKTEIEMHGNYVIFKNCYWDIEEVYYKNPFKKCFVTAKRRLTDEVINTSMITNIIPIQLNEIFDKDFLEAIHELESEGREYKGKNIFK